MNNDEHIFNPVPEPRIPDVVGTYYNAKCDILNGMSDEVVAYKVPLPNDNFNYYVKVNCLNLPYDPHNAEYITISKQRSKLTGQKLFTMAKCTKEGFDSYLKYLKFKKVFDLRKTEKELR